MAMLGTEFELCGSSRKELWWKPVLLVEIRVSVEMEREQKDSQEDDETSLKPRCKIFFAADTERRK